MEAGAVFVDTDGPSFQRAVLADWVGCQEKAVNVEAVMLELAGALPDMIGLESSPVPAALFRHVLAGVAPVFGVNVVVVGALRECVPGRVDPRKPVVRLA